MSAPAATYDEVTAFWVARCDRPDGLVTGMAITGTPAEVSKMREQFDSRLGCMACEQSHLAHEVGAAEYMTSFDDGHDDPAITRDSQQEGPSR